MGLFVSFAALNYTGMDPNLSSMLSFVFGGMSLASPVFSFIINKKFKDNNYNEIEHELDKLESKMTHPGYKFRSFT